jgi:dolichol-phosphate mannosyltransferase
VKISLVLPIYNEQFALAEVLAKYVTDLKHICSIYREQGVSYEIIAVNDGSTDSSVKVLSESARLNRNIRVINFDARYGKQAAVTAGFEAASGDCVILADVDILNPIGVLKRIFDEFLEGEAIVYAYRERFGFDKLSNAVSEWFTNVAAKFFSVDGVYIGRPRIALFSRNVVDVLVALPAKNKFMRAMDNWLGWSVSIIEFSSSYNKKEERSKNNRMQQQFKERGGDEVARSKVREHTSALIISRVCMACAFLLLVTTIILHAAASLHFMAYVFLWIFVLGFIGVSLFTLANAVLVKRVGNIRNRAVEEIFNIKNVLN